MGHGSLGWALGIRYILQTSFTREPCIGVLGPRSANSKVIMYPFVYVPCMYCFFRLKRQKKLSGKGRIQAFLSFLLHFNSPLCHCHLISYIVIYLYFMCNYIICLCFLFWVFLPISYTFSYTLGSLKLQSDSN